MGGHTGGRWVRGARRRWAGLAGSAGGRKIWALGGTGAWALGGTGARRHGRWALGRWALGCWGVGCAAQHRPAQGALGGLGTAMRHGRLGGLGAPVRAG